eukprot:scaffold16513_cov79-Phaeocystis_antarctica.AAC.4
MDLSPRPPDRMPTVALALAMLRHRFTSVRAGCVLLNGTHCLRPYSSAAARGELTFGASPRPSEGSLGGDDTATMRAPP